MAQAVRLAILKWKPPAACEWIHFVWQQRRSMSIQIKIRPSRQFLRALHKFSLLLSTFICSANRFVHICIEHFSTECTEKERSGMKLSIYIAFQLSDPSCAILVTLTLHILMRFLPSIIKPLSHLVLFFSLNLVSGWSKSLFRPWAQTLQTRIQNDLRIVRRHFARWTFTADKRPDKCKHNELKLESAATSVFFCFDEKRVLNEKKRLAKRMNMKTVSSCSDQRSERVLHYEIRWKSALKSF